MGVTCLHICNLPTIPVAITCDHYITGYNILPKVINFIIITSNPLGDKPQLSAPWTTPLAHILFRY